MPHNHKKEVSMSKDETHSAYTKSEVLPMAEVNGEVRREIIKWTKMLF